jgi:hypothetical protein
MTGILLSVVGNTYGAPPSVPINTVLPVITGNVYVGNTLTSSTGTWSGNPTPTYTYQWQKDSINIGGATNSSYTIQASDEGSVLRCVVTATNTAGSTSAASLDTAVVIVASTPANTAVPVLSGLPEENFTLTSSAGTWTGDPAPTYTYQWQRNSVNIVGATSSSYLCVSADVGNTLRCVVTATNTTGSATANSANTPSIYSPPIAYGSAYQGGYFAGQISTSGNGVPTHNIVVAPAASGYTTRQFKTSNTGTTGVLSSIDGPSNSLAMNDASHPAALYCEGLTIGGYSDWYLPAINELRTVFTRLKPTTTGGSAISEYNVPQFLSSAGATPQTSATDFKVGGSEAFVSSGTGTFAAHQHWSSTVRNSSTGTAYSLAFSNGALLSYFKDVTRRVRAIRRVAL